MSVFSAIVLTDFFSDIQKKLIYPNEGGFAAKPKILLFSFEVLFCIFKDKHL